MDKVRMFSRVFAVGAALFLIGSLVFSGPTDIAMMWVVAAIVLVVAVVIIDAVRRQKEN